MPRYEPCYPPGYLIPDKRTANRMSCRKFEFLKLPGEIRNRIYALLFDDLEVLIRGTHPQKQLQHDIKVHRQRVSVSRYRLFPLFAESLAPKVRGGRDSWMSIEILRTCRKVYKEAVPLLYAKTTFRFESMTPLSRFLDGASPKGIQSIKKLQLVHCTYGEPLLLDMREWKVRHDNKWMRLCKRVAEEMGALESLSIDLHVNDWPVQLTTTASWARPLFVLKGDGLSHAEVHLGHTAFSKQRLNATARKLEKEMLSEKGRQMKKVEEECERKRILEVAKAKAKEGPKALRSLRITQPAADYDSNHQACDAHDQHQTPHQLLRATGRRGLGALRPGRMKTKTVLRAVQIIFRVHLHFLARKA